MFPNIWTSSIILLAVSFEVHAHAAVAPVIGLGSTAPQRRDVRIPTVLAPCGLGVNVAQALSKSTPVQAAADGTFTTTVTNFNAGVDGSRQMSAQVDPTASGKARSFVDAVTISQNGEAAPTSTGSEQLVASLPAGTKCTGGTTGDTCLVAFKSLGRFGNCVAVQQSGASNSTATNSTATDTAAGTDASDSADTADSTETSSSQTDNTNGGSDINDTGSDSGSTGATGTEAGTGTTVGDAGATESAQSTGQNRNVNNGGAAGSGAKKAGGATGTANAGGAGALGNQNLAKGRFAQGGTRAARALLIDFKGQGDVVNRVRRGIAGWMWA